jgi:hypothetical protein
MYTPPTGRAWRIHFDSREYVDRRGGDWIAVVDERSGGFR